MPAHVSVFAQIVKLLPKRSFLHLTRTKYPALKSNARKFHSWDQFIALLFCHLSGARSLRELEASLARAVGKLRHVDATAMKRTSLAYANSKQDYHLFQDFYFRTLALYERELGYRLGKRFHKPVYSVDSSTITLGLALYKWALYKRDKSGIKLHTAISNDSLMPVVMDMTAAKVADSTMAKTVAEKLPSDAIIVMDRGYNDYKLFAWFCNRGITFVTRVKEGTLKQYVGTIPIESKTSYYSANFEFSGHKARRTCSGLVFREVTWFDKENDRWFKFLTNDLTLTAVEVALLYRDRWKVELFFKKLKQNSLVTSFIGRSPNAVMCQVWTAATAILLLEVIRRRSKSTWHLSTLKYVLRMYLLSYEDLWECLDNPAGKRRTPIKKKSLPVPAEFRQLTLF